MAATMERRIPSRKGGWGVSVALIALAAPPLVAGTLRLVTLAGLAEIMPDTARFAAVPLPVVMHIVNAAVFAVLGAFQFAAGFRRRRPRWHRAAGRLVVVCGLLAGLSGLWMALFYPRAHNVGDLLTAFRLLFGSAMVVSFIVSPPTELSRALQDGAGWAINLAVAEWIIRRRLALPARTARKQPIQRRTAPLVGRTA